MSCPAMVIARMTVTSSAWRVEHAGSAHHAGHRAGIACRCLALRFRFGPVLRQCRADRLETVFDRDNPSHRAGYRRSDPPEFRGSGAGGSSLALAAGGLL